MNKNEYDGHWITTKSGVKFHYLDPQPEEILIKDISHALALTCRFGGHCYHYYSVAQHSVYVAEASDYENALAALLHDASEAYVPDVPRPIKQDVPRLREIEDKIQKAILKKFNALEADWDFIKYLDNAMLAREAKDLMPNTTDWADLPEPIEMKLEIWSPEKSKEEFEHLFVHYMK